MDDTRHSRTRNATHAAEKLLLLWPLGGLTSAAALPLIVGDGWFATVIAVLPPRRPAHARAAETAAEPVKLHGDTHNVAVAWVLLLHYTVPDRSYEYSISDTAAATTASASATRRVHNIDALGCSHSQFPTSTACTCQALGSRTCVLSRRVCLPGNAMARAGCHRGPLSAVSRGVGSGGVLPQHLRRRRAFCPWWYGRAVTGVVDTVPGADLCSPVRTARQRLRSGGDSSTLVVIFMIFCARTYRVAESAGRVDRGFQCVIVFLTWLCPVTECQACHAVACAPRQCLPRRRC